MCGIAHKTAHSAESAHTSKIAAFFFNFKELSLWHALVTNSHKGIPARNVIFNPRAERVIPMKTKREHRPWIQPNGKPVYTSILKRICRRWDAETWEAYLRWYQTPCKEALLRGNGYDIICGNRTEPIYQEFGYEHDELIERLCENLLRSLPKTQASVLRLYYQEGLTELQVSRRLRISQPGVHYRRKKALFSLGRKNPNEILIAIHIIRGLLPHSTEERAPSFWESSSGIIRKDLAYDPANWKAEFEAIERPTVGQAISELTENQQRIIYLRLWCDQPGSQIARQLGIGINTVQDICAAAVSKLKRRVVELIQNQEEVLS
jgi:DNA-directed RNA polymerase specialized sigma subunit